MLFTCKISNILIFSFFLISCQTKPVKNEIGQLSDTSVLKEVTFFRADTIRNRSIGKGFYINNKGDIFEMRTTALGDMVEGTWARTIFLDSTIVINDYENRESLRNFIDIDSYKSFPDGYYSKDKNYVFYTWNNSDGGVRFLIKNADPRTFSVIKYRWAKDNRRVFYENKVVEGANPKTIIVFGDYGDSAKDEHYLYVNGEVVRE